MWYWCKDRQNQPIKWNRVEIGLHVCGHLICDNCNCGQVINWKPCWTHWMATQKKRCLDLPLYPISHSHQFKVDYYSKWAIKTVKLLEENREGIFITWSDRDFCQEQIAIKNWYIGVLKLRRGLCWCLCSKESACLHTGHRFSPWSQEDLTNCGATKSMCRCYRACALEPRSHSYEPHA